MTDRTLPRRPRLTVLATALMLVSTLGCVDKPKTGDTTNTTLYVFDTASNTVKVWADVNTVVTTPSSPPAADRTLSAASFSNMGTLGWGGMALDPSGNRLYLVSEGGTVVRVERLRSQTGVITLAADVITFTLGDPNVSTDRLAGGSTFGQIAINPSLGTLYATETATSGSTTRIWVVPNAGSVGGGTKVASSNVLRVGDALDRGGSGAGVAVNESGVAYAFLTGGSLVYDSLGQNGTDGPRLRSSSNNTFAASTNVLIGSLTQLGSSPTYGSLAYDTNADILYATRPDSTGLAAVLAFKPGQFALGTFNQAPDHALPDSTSTLPYLRFISHCGNKDWLAGANFTSAATGTGTGSNTLLLWKGPSIKNATTLAYPSAVTVTLPSSIVIRGLAFDGNK